MTHEAKMDAPSAIQYVSRKLRIDLKEKQKEAILAILERKDVFCILPTGYGKSIIYGVLPMTFDALLGKSVIMQ